MTNLLLRLIALCFLALGLAGCGLLEQEETAPTPPIAEQREGDATSTATVLSPTSTDLPSTRTPPPPATAEQTATPTALPPTETPPPSAAPVSEIQLVAVASGISRLTYLTHAFDERLFVTQQRGRIQVLVDGQVLAAPFLDITDRVAVNAPEQGLLSVAFHPDYAENGFFYVNYTDTNGDTVVSRFQVSDDANRAEAGSETVLLNIRQPYGNHNGGQLQFGPDGYLYVGMGDGGSGGDPENNGQNPNTLLGALLRLDVDQGSEEVAYAIPPDNPYVDREYGRNEIWAIGLRNPWRFSFDRLTQDLYIADVGQQQYEEVNFAPAGHPGGLNYGWNVMEGAHCYGSSTCDTEGLVQPVAEYDHGQGCSITGGYVYRGSRFPELAGNYFFGDFCSGLIWSVFNTGDGWQQTVVAQSDLNITSFGEDAAGELYVVTQGGEIYQIQP